MVGAPSRADGGIGSTGSDSPKGPFLRIFMANITKAMLVEDFLTYDSSWEIWISFFGIIGALEVVQNPTVRHTKTNEMLVKGGALGR